MSSEIDKEGQKCFIGTGPAAPAVGRRDQAWYQLSHGITDTKRPLQPLLNEFFFGVFLKHPAAMSYGTSGTSGKPPEESKVNQESGLLPGSSLEKRRKPWLVCFFIGFSKSKALLIPANARYFAGSGGSPARVEPRPPKPALRSSWYGLPSGFRLAGSPPSIGDKSKVQCRPSRSWPPVPSTFDTLRSGCPVKSTRKDKNVLSVLGLQRPQWVDGIRHGISCRMESLIQNGPSSHF